MLLGSKNVELGSNSTTKSMTNVQHESVQFESTKPRISEHEGL